MVRQHIFALAILALAAGCGVDTVVAPRDEVRPVELRTFPAQNWRLANNKFFLWREDMTPEHVSRAVAIAKEIDELDSAALPLNRQRLELDARLNPLKDELRALTSKLRPIKTQVTKTKKSLLEAQAAVGEAEAKLTTEKNKPNPSAETVAELEAAVAAAKQTVAPLESALVDLTAQQAAIERDMALVKAVLDPIQTEVNELESRQLVIELKGREKVDEIMTVVEWYKDQPSSVSFQFTENGSISASINGWNMGDDLGPRNYSTEASPGLKPTMGEVRYTERGGVFEFDVYVYTDEVQTALRETYHFRISRIKYDYPDGRIFYGGEISRTLADGTIRRGLAKLVDRNN